MKYKILTPAIAEADAAARFYENRVPGLGGDFMEEMGSAISRILQFPDAWAVISKSFRHCNFRRFPYTVIYTLEEGSSVLIVSIFHLHREPRSWRTNLREPSS